MILPTTNKEEQLLRVGHKFIAGVDEVGRGPLAGPVVAGSVIFNFPLKAEILNLKSGISQKLESQKFIKSDEFSRTLIRDSKLLSEKQRWEAYKWVLDNAMAWGIGIVSHREIDELGIRIASLLAMEKAVQEMSQIPDVVLIDGRDVIGRNVDVYQEAIVKGDRDIFSIAAASIIAKVTRDEIMKKIDKKFPQYDFAKHKGYGTAEHRRCIEKYGLCEIHRRSFHLRVSELTRNRTNKH